MSVPPAAAASFTACMQLFKDDSTLIGRNPEIAFGDYTDFVHGAAILRGLCRRGELSEGCDLLNTALQHAYRELKKAIEAEDWDAARAWLRPGIAHDHKTYDACERNHPAELGETARQGRADGLREGFWCRMVKETLLFLSSPSTRPSLQEHITFRVLYVLDMLNQEFSLDRVDLSDDRFGDGTVLEVWMNDLHPYLTHRKPEFLQYETELRSRSPLAFNSKLALLEGLHARLGASSNVRLLTDELAQMIVNSSNTTMTYSRRAPTRLIPHDYFERENP
jgi:hypothetical protein